MWGGSENIIKTGFPPPINLDYAKIYPVTRLKYLVNATIPSLGDTTGTKTIIANLISVTGILADTQPSNHIGGRTLAISLSGNNILL